MILREVLYRTRDILASNNIEDAPMESELLIRQVLNYNRVQLYQNMKEELSPDKQNILQFILERRLSGEPAAYITGSREFYGLDFYVNKDVLIPRPETEHLVEKAISLASRYGHPVIADIGTGSGAIAVSLAVNLATVSVFATDISFDALKVADINCHKHNVQDRITLLCGNLLDPLPQKANIIAANLPYVKRGEIPINSHEPMLALDGGEDGLDIIRLLCRQVEDKIYPDGHLLLEIGLGQKDAVVNLLEEISSVNNIEVIPDLRGIDRVVCASFE
jgi:release factor glutamine methyltransferase